MADQQKIKRIEKVLEENQIKQQERVRELMEALDQERRKSMVDEKRAKDIERALNEKIYFLNELTRKKEEDDQELNALRQEI